MSELQLRIGPLAFKLTGDYPAAAREVAGLYGDSGVAPCAHYRMSFHHEAGPPFHPLPAS